MDDSNILYYLALAGIYIISRAFKKKKPQNQPAEDDAPKDLRPQQTAHSAPTKRPTSVEDILKELTKEFDEKPQPAPQKAASQEIKPVYDEPAYEPTPEVQVDYQKKNIEEIGPDEEIDIVPHKQLVREKPSYERADKFKIVEDQDDAIDEVYELLDEEDGPKKAMILKEIFERKY